MPLHACLWDRQYTERAQTLCLSKVLDHSVTQFSRKWLVIILTWWGCCELKQINPHKTLLIDTWEMLSNCYLSLSGYSGFILFHVLIVDQNFLWEHYRNLFLFCEYSLLASDVYPSSVFSQFKIGNKCLHCSQTTHCFSPTANFEV